MAELLAFFVEVFVALLEAIVALAHVLLEVVALLACFLFSKTFRAKKREQWTASPRRKFMEVGLAAVFLTGLSLTSIMLLSPSKGSDSRDKVELLPAAPQKGEDMRVRLRPRSTNEPEQVVVVKEGGLAKIGGTRTIHELGQEIKKNVSVIPVEAPSLNQPVEE